MQRIGVQYGKIIDAHVKKSTVSSLRQTHVRILAQQVSVIILCCYITNHTNLAA